MNQGSEGFLDPSVARTAGASQHIIRDYLDEKSGEKASALIVYGLGVTVHLHTPEVCYPAAGYQLVKGPIVRSISVPGVKGPVRYRWAIYSKREGGITRYEEAYFTFLHDGNWVSDAADRWKLFRYHPGLFKVQISHTGASLSENGEGPCQALLAELVREINDRVSAGGSGTDKAATPTATATAPKPNDPA